MATELYDVAVLMEEVLSRLEVREKGLFGLKLRIGEQDRKGLFGLKSDILVLLNFLFRLADTDTKVKLRALEIKRKIGSRLEFESAEALAAKRIGYKGRSRETQSQIATTVWESKGSTMEVVELLLQQARADSELGDKFKKMLISVYKSEARSTEEKGSFELGSISFLFNQMWDNVRQLELLVSTDAAFLATSMLNTMADHVSKLQLCSQDVDWLCTWVPEFDQKFKRIKKNDPMDKKMMKGAEMEEAHFAAYINSWDRLHRRNNSITFEDSTTVSSMLFTHYMPGHHPLFADLMRTMQIFSIKITELRGFNFNWPLEVYGMVAARDGVDYRRNNLFLRSRDNCQFLEKDSYLHLTGPSRAILSTDPVQIEIQLKVKGTMKSEDRNLITKAFTCDHDASDTLITHSINGCFAKIELCCEHVRGSIQATIISIRVMKGSLLSANGVHVICSSLPEEDAEGEAEHTLNSVVLLDGKDGAAPVDEEGYLELSRQVVSVQLKGTLEVVTKTDVMRGSVVFKPELSNISQERCFLGDCELEITVAWSFLVEDEQDMLMMSYTKALIVPTTSPFMKLVEDTEGGSC
uniref:Uncharacterized protein n=1 Tax=Avena sativa TaxID=4498 RepID=A0ACD5UWY6_AVESA